MPEKGKVPEGLRPKEPVLVPKAVFKSLPRETQLLLTQLGEAREAEDKEEQRKLRIALRKKGFYLSNLEEGGGKPEAAAPVKGKAKSAPVETEEEEEEEAPPTKKLKAKAKPAPVEEEEEEEETPPPTAKKKLKPKPAVEEEEED